MLFKSLVGHHRKDKHHRRPKEERASVWSFPTLVFFLQLLLCVVLHQLWHWSKVVLRVRHWQQSHQTPQRKRQTAQQDALDPLVLSQVGGANKVSAILHDHVLGADSKYNNGHEERIPEESFEHIHRVVDRSSIHFVEHLTENEGVEYDGDVLPGVHRHVEVRSTDEKQIGKQQHLEDKLDKDVAHHLVADQTGISFVGPSVEQLCRRWLCAQSQRSHGVHDQVYPKHHHRI
mmetsp:Transcript_19970/g.27526  ORF Transcript_19970/g.27526 Transcript_19970/m.27526 type:complete len:232 (-) Transcript_19970:2476-3171(-)